MMLPLVVLAIGAVFAGWLNFNEEKGLGAFLGNSPSFSAAFHTAQRAGGVEHAVVRPLPFGQIEAQEMLKHDDKELVEGDESRHYMFMAVSGLIALVSYIAHR